MKQCISLEQWDKIDKPLRVKWVRYFNTHEYEMRENGNLPTVPEFLDFLISERLFETVFFDQNKGLWTVKHGRSITQSHELIDCLYYFMIRMVK